MSVNGSKATATNVNNLSSSLTTTSNGGDAAAALGGGDEITASSNSMSPSASSGAAGAAANADENPGAVVPAGNGKSLKDGDERLRELEALFLEGPESAHEAKALSTETLLDILLILFNECCNSSLRKEKTLTDFIELGKNQGLSEICSGGEEGETESITLCTHYVFCWSRWNTILSAFPSKLILCQGSDKYVCLLLRQRSQRSL
jgi:hypothetical protein